MNDGTDAYAKLKQLVQSSDSQDCKSLRRENNKYLFYLKRDVWDSALHRDHLPMHSKDLLVAKEESKQMKNGMQLFNC